MVKNYNIKLPRIFILNSIVSKFNNAGNALNNKETTEAWKQIFQKKENTLQFQVLNGSKKVQQK